MSKHVPSIIGLHVSLNRRINSSNTHAIVHLYTAVYITIQRLTTICTPKQHYASFYWILHHHTALYKQLPQFGAKISKDICPRTLSVPRYENCELRGTDDVQGQISVQIFALNRSYCVLYSSTEYFATHLKKCLWTAYWIELIKVVSFQRNNGESIGG